MTHSFFGGVYPAVHKEITRRKPMARLPQTPKEVIIPLTMCADGPSTPIVAPGDPVTVGQPVARRGHTGAAAHAGPTPGAAWPPPLSLRTTTATSCTAGA